MERESLTGIRRGVSGLIVLLVLYLAIVPQIPNRHCRCHDSKSSPQQKSECPFGQLRALGSSLAVLDPAIEIIAQVVRVAGHTNFIIKTVVTANLHLSSLARAPPV